MTCINQRAREILLEWDLYRSMSPSELGARIDIPLELGFATVLPEGIFLSWSWLELETGGLGRMVAGDAPHHGDWSTRGPICWLMDVAARPGTKGVHVGRAINRYMLLSGRVNPGERGAFRRHRGARYGWAIVQEVG